MEIDLDDIDFGDIPGYTPITNAIPVWKRDVIERKNREKLEEYLESRKREKEEADKWKNVPVWKRKLMQEKDKEKKQKDAEVEKETMPSIPRGDYLRNYRRESVQAEEDKRLRVKEQQEYERQMEEELKTLPAWKREVMMKRGGGIKNWGDDRAEINEQEQENGDDQGFCNMEAEDTGDKVYVQKTSLVLKKDSTNPMDAKRLAVRPSEEETQILEDWESVPAWKREIMMKRGGAPSNWGDERGGVNEIS